MESKAVTSAIEFSGDTPLDSSDTSDSSDSTEDPAPTPLVNIALELTFLRSDFRKGLGTRISKRNFLRSPGAFPKSIIFNKSSRIVLLTIPLRFVFPPCIAIFPVALAILLAHVGFVRTISIISDSDFCANTSVPYNGVP